MSNADLGAKVPSSIVWNNTGIPTNSEEIDNANLIQVENTTVGAPELGQSKNILEYPTLSHVGAGPGGDMFGTSAPDAAGIIAEAETFADSKSVMTRPSLEAIEAVEGFGEPEKFSGVTLLKGIGIAKATVEKE